MIVERARLAIKEGEEQSFEAIIPEVVPLFLRAKGCHGVRFERVVERPSVYILVVEWETLEDHTVGFHGSDEFKKWRAFAEPYFAQPPEVEHVAVVERHPLRGA